MKKTVKITSFILCFMMVLALALPAFAEGTYPAPEIKILNENESGYYAKGTKIEYEIILSGKGAQYIKVNNTKLDFKDFKKKDNKFVYDGSFVLTKNSTLTVAVGDMLMNYPTFEFKKSIDFKIDSDLPVLQVSTVATGVGIFKSAFIEVIASDSKGLSKIEISSMIPGEKDIVLADAKELAGKKIYRTAPYEISVNGTYFITVTDNAGNKNMGYVKYADGKIDTNIAVTESAKSVVTASMFRDDPILYYYFLYNKDSAINENFWYYYQLLQLSKKEGEEDDTNASLMYWLLLNSMKKTEKTGEEETETDNRWIIYYLLNADKNAADSKVLYSILMNSKGIDNDKLMYLLLNSKNISETDSRLLYALLLNEDTDSSVLMNYLLYGNTAAQGDSLYLYYLMGGTNPLSTYNPYDKQYLAHEYFQGTALLFTNGSDIKYETKDGKMTMSAPEVRDNRYVKYQWMKKGASDKSWSSVKDAISSKLTVTPVKGDQYKVVYSSNFYYKEKESDILTVTEDMLKDTPVKPAPEPEKEDDVFDSDDIVIKTLAYNTPFAIDNMISIKIGSPVLLLANYQKGYWSYDTSMLSCSGNIFTTTFTAAKSGFTILTYTAFNDKGESATKNIFVQITE